MDLGLTDRRAVVVGAGRGLGAEVAVQLAAHGARLALVARGHEGLTTTAARIRDIGGEAVTVTGDVADDSDAERAVTEAINGLGGVDVLVNSATASAAGGFDELSDEQWGAALDVKPRGFARAIRTVLPVMRAAGRGRIVNICGSGGRFVTTDYALGAANAGTLHLTKLIAEAEGPHGISAIAINPGAIHTPRLNDFLAAQATALGRQVEEHRADYLRKLPLRRLPSAEEVARIVVLFCADLTEYCSGSAVQVDGASMPGIF